LVQVLGPEGELLVGQANLPPPDLSVLTPAVGQIQHRDDFLGDVPIRVAHLWLQPPGSEAAEALVLVQVAETLDERSQLAAEILKGVLVPQYAILPLAVLMVWLALSRGLSPLEALQSRIRLRRSSDLSPIDESDTPEEVAPLVRAINDLLSRLDQSVAGQKRFLADAAHQLKTPLAGLRMQAELAEREIEAGGDVEAARNSLRQIARATQSATRMVNQLLAMARAEDAEQALRPQVVDLNEIAADVVQDFVPKAMDKRIDLGYEPPPPPPPGREALQLKGNPVLLRELLRNLVDNALQYTPAGGSVTVRLLHDVYGRVAVLQVEDTGVGIPEAERELVFKPFYRALGTNVDGSGLGLAIVQEIVQRHAGTVSIGDTVERTATHAASGTRFTVRLPADRRSLAPAPATPVG
jgi:two-component system, OmpR family, sensor histidine kinase TctE